MCCLINADMCLARSNFAFINPDTEEDMLKTEQIMQWTESKSYYCTTLVFMKAAIGTFFNSLSILPYYKTIAEEFPHKVEKECPYGDGNILCIGIQKDECDKILVSYISTD